MNKKQNESKKAITIRLNRELWQKTRRVLFEKETTFQDAAEKAFIELTTQ